MLKKDLLPTIRGHPGVHVEDAQASAGGTEEIPAVGGVYGGTLWNCNNIIIE